jgi:hypothetical protein
MSADGAGEAPETTWEASEIDRLRRLVGPDEMSYTDRLEDLAAAEQAVRDAEHANGELRATIAELRVELRRAQQDQFHVWKVLARPTRLLRALRRTADPR